MDREESSTKIRQLKCEMGRDYLKREFLGDTINFWIEAPCMLVLMLFDLILLLSAIEDGNVPLIVFISVALATAFISGGLILSSMIKKKIRWNKIEQTLTTDTLLSAYTLLSIGVKLENKTYELITQSATKNGK